MRFPDLNRYDYFSLDSETTGLNYPVDKAFSFSISTPDEQDFYFDIRHDPMAITWLNDMMKGYKGEIACHNASFDFKMLDQVGIKIPLDRLRDTCIMAVLIDEHLMSYDLDTLGKKYIGSRKESDIYEKLAALFGGRATKNVQMPNISRAPVDIVAPYAKQDTRITLDLFEWQKKAIARQGIEDIVNFEHEIMPTIVRAEMRGIRVSVEEARRAMDRLTPKIEELQARVNAMAGSIFNVNSPDQVKKFFCPQEIDGTFFVGDTMIGKTPKGGPSLGADSLREIKHPMATMILDIRSLMKTRDTFLKKHVIEHSVNNRVYPNINQTKGESGGTGTGRLSYTDPAMQQIPSRNKEVAEIVKPCFLPEEGHKWVDLDENSFEVRVFAHLVNNEEIIQAYHENPELDLHQFVADLTGLVRNAKYSGQPNAKQLNLSMIFNSGNGAIADKMGMPWEWESFIPRGKTEKDKITYKKAGPEATSVIERYHRRIPGVKELAQACKSEAERSGFIFTDRGRRLRFPRGYKSYKASGLLIQATAADINKENWKKIEDALGNDGHLILNVHDSYGMSVPEDWKPYYNKVKRVLEEPRLRVPLIADLNGAGDSWWDAIKGK